MGVLVVVEDGKQERGEAQQRRFQAHRGRHGSRLRGFPAGEHPAGLEEDGDGGGSGGRGRARRDGSALQDLIVCEEMLVVSGLVRTLAAVSAMQSLFI